MNNTQKLGGVLSKSVTKLPKDKSINERKPITEDHPSNGMHVKLN